jgi:cation/acetate symporter
MRRVAFLAGLLASTPAWAAQGAVSDEYKWLTFAVFGAIITLTLCITWWAARRAHTTSEFYAAGRTITGAENGWALAGDYISAASFLGMAGLISLYGYDGFMYSVGWLVAYITVLLLIAEPCRNIGKYTLGDVLAFRNRPKATKTVTALSSMMVSVFYITAQMVGGGLLVKTLIGIDYEISIIVVGLVMMAYVVFGGMVATTWVQIVKAGLLVTTSLVLVVLVWMPYGFSLPAYLEAVAGDAGVQRQVAGLLGDAAANMSAAELGQRFLEPGLLFGNPLDQISLGLALVLGTGGMPHILMRFFTVPNAQEARRSVVWAMAIIGSFYIMTLFLGLGAAMHVGPDVIAGMDSGGNMASPLLAQYLGGGADSLGGNFLLAVVAAVAFATIVAVVAGLVLASASALAHDIYVGVIRGDHATPMEQMKAARISALIVGIVAIVIGIAAKDQNVAHLVGMAFAVAASSNLPAVFLTLYWKRCNTGGVVLGMVVGAVSAIVLVMVSPNMTYPRQVVAEARAVLEGTPTREAQPARTGEGLSCELFAVCQKAEPAKPALAAQPGALDRLAHLQGHLPLLTEPAAIAETQAQIARMETDIAKARADLARYEGKTTSMVGLEQPFFQLMNPGIISIPLGFLCVILGSLLYRDPRAEAMWDELYVRQNTGIHVEGAYLH